MTEDVEFSPEQQREQEVSEVLEKLKFMESQGVDPLVVTRSGESSGKFGAFIPGRHRPPAGGVNWTKVGTYLEDLHQMHKNKSEREIILEAWERFQDEE